MDDLRLHDFSDLSLDEGIALIEAEILDEYLQPHEYPWVIGYSGGKDSTLVAHLVFKALLKLPRSQRTRQIHIVSNDTLVESPLVGVSLCGSRCFEQQAVTGTKLRIGN